MRPFKQHNKFFYFFFVESLILSIILNLEWSGNKTVEVYFIYYRDAFELENSYIITLA